MPSNSIVTPGHHGNSSNSTNIPLGTNEKDGEDGSVGKHDESNDAAVSGAGPRQYGHDGPSNLRRQPGAVP